PLCLVCPWMERCQAHQHGTAAQLPVKLRKVSPVQIAADLLVIQKGRRILLRQREPQARRMAGFWDLPCAADLPAARPTRGLDECRHTITHHHYRFSVWSAASRSSARTVGAAFRWFCAAELSEIPLSTTARKALKFASFTSCESFVKHGG